MRLGGERGPIDSFDLNGTLETLIQFVKFVFHVRHRYDVGT
jgi:hypothetical protein